MRDNHWLEEKLNKIWQEYFADIERSNEIEIKFGAKARRRLGSIRQIDPKDKNSKTRILMSGFFCDERVPELMIDATIAHELAHYAHGFCSPLPKLSRYPHQGGKVDNELKKRGFGKILKFQQNWLKTEWPKIIGKSPARRRRKTTYRKKLIRLLGF
ncbi:hypothetical protein COT78_02910 [Candidatus Berkelbacteria bacterium CG10_big_fil_rev_8_21_14_0_10_43_13]|uniref:SprT-like domain-containing protein n=1 Tax=Candidatus Berkelbacteria bacterium CG10_big_fil_rev_8_21_14_0_10_43_13 TaxID=1974514 RepID=A0A2H0W6J6_9BACT|nr:MAG: hypothetical protein COT78_02910 [Candidatus Berkelbacteria bacterium CG10_big_fil_rev_8_21_14_0_10_43_13]